MIFKNNKVYDILKYIAQIGLPAIGTFYVSLAGLWNLPFPKEVSGTIMAIDTLLGTLLLISNNAYNKQINEVNK